ncbi:hypothetical protein HGH93_23435 [Chitinophaga polysaccharea]|uniref:polymorphic toxin type 23 domain-containing protein n=1 Tax=Chitinophaga polysaccharea TaxID=1293035 RepID=UPI0014559F86|nr:polymorphic toxin type 23 domain-containing protein [Chitinophaga polysaccharea]NLR61076.1 hypothetical protein [Chitinophaga polysaccharea]
MAINAVANQFIPPFAVPINDNFSISISMGLGLGTNGLTWGGNYSLAYKNGDVSLSAGFGGGTNKSSYGIGGSVGGIGVSRNWTSYGDAIGPDGVSNKQRVDGVGLKINDFSFRLENDFFGGEHGDRWRTNAWELGVGNFVLGGNIYTNENIKGSPRDDRPSPIYGVNQRPGFRTWANGQVYSSPLWVGFRSGNNVYRFGYSSPVFQDLQQNGLHQSNLFTFGNQNYYLGYNHFNGGAYSYHGYYDPFSLF